MRPPDDGVFQRLGGTLEQQRAAGLLHRDFLAGELGIVHALEIHEVAAVIDDGDEHVPVVFLRLLFGGGGDPLGGGQGKSLLVGEHVAQCSRGRAGGFGPAQAAIK